MQCPLCGLTVTGPVHNCPNFIPKKQSTIYQPSIIDDFSRHSAAVDKIVLLSATLAGCYELLSQYTSDDSCDIAIAAMMDEIDTVLGRKVTEEEVPKSEKL
jgi:hypothetical protein